MQFSLRDDAVSGKPDLQITMVVNFLPRFWSDSQMLLKAVSNLENWGAPAHPINLRKGLICHKTVKGRKRKMMNAANFSIAPASFTEVLNCFILLPFFSFFFFFCDELKCKCYFDLLVERGCQSICSVGTVVVPVTGPELLLYQGVQFVLIWMHDVCVLHCSPAPGAEFWHPCHQKFKTPKEISTFFGKIWTFKHFLILFYFFKKWKG